MSDLSVEILKLELSDDIFHGIKFFISGEVHEEVIDLLKCGGAERLNYFSDYVTHLIVGTNPEENDIVDANDVYEIPALIPKWIVMCARLKKLVRTKPYLYIPGGKLLSNLVFCFSNVREDLKYLWSLITFNGGTVQLNLTSNCNYLVATDTSGAKYERAESLGSEHITIVTPDWVVETIKNSALADPVVFHPKLINWPKPVKHESTTAITGFEPEYTDENERNEEKGVSVSTQALLEKLKQRMPWNQPSTPKASSDPIAPPNVVAPSFIQKGQTHQTPRSHISQVSTQPLPVTPQSPVSSNFPQMPRSPSSLPNQHIPRSIVHHTPSPGAFQEQQNPLNLGRLINQPQARPNLQQLRGQLGPSQLHQQLLQQRMQQNQQNIIQRTSTGQITVQQQLLQQQLVQRQLLQNQLSQQQRQGTNQQTIGQNPQAVGQNQQQIGPNQHMGQLSQQQLAQLQQQQLLKQNQQQLQQQLHIGQNQQQQIPLGQNQQLLQNQVMQQQNQLNQQQNQMTQQQNPINQQNQMSQQQQGQMNQQQQGQLSQQQQGQMNQQQQGQMNQQQGQINQQQQGQMNQQQQGQMNQQQQGQMNQQQQGQMNQQQQGQMNQQQQIQMNQGQNFLQQNINQNLQQKPSFLNQQQTVTSQQQIIQNQPNLSVQQFVNQNFSQNANQEMSLQNMQQSQQQQPVTQQQNISQQLNAQVLNQQLSSQNLGQQLNQQQLNQQMNQQQSQMNPQIVQQNALLNQQLNQQTPMGQPLNQPDQISQQLNPQGQLNQLNQQQNINQHSLEQGLTQNINQALNQQLNQGISQHLQQQQINRQSLQQQQLNNQQMQAQQQLNQQQQQISQINQQLNSPLPQQVVRTQFQQQGNVNQQILINQQSPQSPSLQRAQINQHLWAQQPSQVPAQQIIRHSVNVVQPQSPRVQWSPNAQQANVVPQRQFIHLDARTHNELQKMPPEQQALFVAKLQRQRQLLKQAQQRGVGGSHILIRGNVPPGLTTQQQFQWLQQQAKQQGIVLPPNIQQQNITPGTLTQQGLAQNIQHAPGLSPINQNSQQFAEQNPQQQLHLRQYRLQQLQLQREQAQKNHLAQQQQAPIQQPTIVRPIGQPQLADSTTNPPPVPEAGIQHPLVVNAKTKTALANMLSIKLQSGGSSMGVQRPEPLPEPSASGTLRLMTAQHNAAINSKPQEIIALQRRTISGPNGEIIKPPGAQPLPITPTSDPPKLQYCPKPTLPLQHRPGPFYGHNPNLKLPPDLFLLGCIFVVVELESFLEKRIPGWQQKIEKHGGEVEKQYCNRVTHVLCETQRHGVVMQALRDCKRCVTIVWLSDVMARKQVLPPWTALHLPNIYLDTAPASKHLISISGFEGSDRNRVKHMIQYTGAKCTTYFSKHNTLLIAAKAEGRKCTYAKKWQIPVVNVQWLTDVMLGNFTAMNQMEHQIYQQFSNPPNFSFDPKLVPNLMLAWKAPINISQESYERVKRSASPVALPKKVKKQKTEPTDENDNISDDHVTNSTYRILFSMFADATALQKIVRDLGGSVAKDHSNFTHLVMPHLARSHKLFFAIAKGALVLSEQWLRDSQAANQFLPETNYNLNSKDFNYKYKCDIDQTFLTRNRNRLLEGKFFFVTPSVFPSKKLLAELIQSCGGVVERIRRSSAQIEATSVNSPYSYFIVTHENDLHLVADLLKNKKDKMRIVCNVELIFSAVLKQTFEVEPYAVCVL